MEFNTGYILPMDRDYGGAHPEDSSTADIGLSPIKDIGFSVPFGIAAQNVQGVAAKIRTGARTIELQFPGAGRSQRGAQTPEIYGEMQRVALEELSRANSVDFTTHASFSVMGLAGMDQQGNFSKQNKKFAVDEIKKAIEFAADVARGGNVTIHTGEFQRPISEEPWAVDPETGRYIFKNYADEPERATIKVVDERNGQIAAQARKNQNVARPVWLSAKPGESYYDENGNERIANEGEVVYVDYNHKRVSSMEARVPEFNQENGRFKVEYWDWDRFIREARERTEEARRFWRENRSNSERWRDSIYLQFKDANSENEIYVAPEEAYVQATLETNAANARGWALYYGGDFNKELEAVNKLEKAYEMYKEIEEKVKETGEEWRLKQAVSEIHGIAPGLVPSDYKLPTEMIEDALRQYRRKMEQAREASTSQEQQAADAYETMRHVMSQHKYALKEAYDAYAEAGMFAMAKSRQIEKQGKLKQPIFVAMENIFPESYGGHPDELITLVDGARGAMIARLRQQGYNEEEAKNAAQDHIKGHLDTGHLNMWRKYWVGDERLSPEENEKRYNEWMLKKVEEMASKNMIGSVHLTDNYGYQDEHLAPGQGNAQVAEMVRILKNHGYKGPLVVEPGADATTDLSDFHGLMKTWRLFGSSVYSIGAGGSQPTRQKGWGDIQYGYFGKGQPPYFVFGAYSPSEDWTLWSSVPME